MEDSAMESFTHQVSCYVFLFLSNFDIDCLDELEFGLGKGVAELAEWLGGRARAGDSWCHSRCSSI